MKESADWREGCAYLISQYYRRYELQKRFTIFFSASIVGGAFGGVSLAQICDHHVLMNVVPGIRPREDEQARWICWLEMVSPKPTSFKCPE